MERTRIVHYTRSRTPLILSPTSPTTPRLPSSSSLSSLASLADDKAPLASIDTEHPSTPRRSSKSGEQGNTRSSSAGRLLDDPKLQTSVYTAVRCQDYPVPPSPTVKLRERNENSTKQRPRSDFTPSHNADDDDANRRNTLGTWSRTRMASQNDGQNTAPQRNSSTLPRRPRKNDSSASNTLVKSRQRYTWLSSRQTAPQGPTVTVPLRQKVESIGDPLTSPLRNGPKANPRPLTVVYDWKTDPRRRPCNFGDAFDLTPPHTPTEPNHGTGDILSQENGKGSTSTDTGYSSTTENNSYGAVPSPATCRSKETCFDSRNPHFYDSEKSDVSHLDTSIVQGYINAPSSENRLQDFTHDDNSRRKETADDLFNQNPSKYNYKQDFPSSPSATHSNSNGKDSVRLLRACHSFRERDFSVHSGSHKVNRCNSFGHDSLHVSFVNDNVSEHTKNVNKFNSLQHVERKHDSNSASNSPTGSTTKSSFKNGIDFSLPRNRYSFKMAVGGCDSWPDLAPDQERSSGLSQKFLSVGGPQKNESVQSKVGKESVRNQYSKEDEIFVSCNDFISNEHVRQSNGLICDGQENNYSEYSNVVSDSTNRLQVGDLDDTGEGDRDDSLTRRIKRNSMRLATASLSDLTCAIDDLDISQEDTTPFPDQNEEVDSESTFRILSLSPIKKKTNLSRTGSLLSSQHSSSFGSFYSCQSMDAISFKNSPSSNASHRMELRSRFDSPMNSRFNKNHFDQTPWDARNPTVSVTTSSSPMSTPSSGRSRTSHRQRPVYYWTRQSPYPKLLHTASSSVASSKGSSDNRPPSPQPSISSSIYTDMSNRSNGDRNAPKENRNRPGLDKGLVFRLQPPPGSSSRPIDRRSMTLPITSPLNPGPGYPDNCYNPYMTDLSPPDIGEYSPDSNTVRSPPSLGRPRRKQYAGFDSQPLPMDSFMSDSSSVYTGVSCSSRATDMTGQPDNSQFNESFMSEDIRSMYEEDSRGDISFDQSETLKSSLDINGMPKEDENDSKLGSIHSTSTTKHCNGDSSTEDKAREDGSVHNITDDELIDGNDSVSYRIEKQFGSGYDALFRLYKSDDVIGQRDMFTSPTHPFYLQNGKAFSSSCLLRSQLYSKRKFLSTRDIFDLIRNSNKTPLDGTVSLTSLERHADKVCEAILCCDEIEQGYMGKETHSLV